MGVEVEGWRAARNLLICSTLVVRRLWILGRQRILIQEPPSEGLKNLEDVA
jgi:hypothetical protein